MAQGINFYPIADTYLDRTNSALREVNFGGDDILKCGPQRSALFRFWITGLPKDCTVQAVTFALTKGGSAQTGTSYLRRLLSSGWTEYGATDAKAVFDSLYWACGTYDPYDNHTGFGSGLDYEGTNLSIVQTNQSDPNGTVYTFPSTTALVALLQSCVNKSEILNLCIPFGAGLHCYSRHTIYKPELNIQYLLPPPVISSFTPLSAASTGATITVYGDHFGIGLATLDRIELINQGYGVHYELPNETWISAQEVRADLHPEIQPGTYRVRVTIDGLYVDSLQTFAFNSPSPTISSLSPTSSKPSHPPILEITGANLDAPVTQVALIGQAHQGEKNAVSVTRISSTQITATLPSNLPLGSYRVRVVSNGNPVISDQVYRCAVGPVVW